jgi:hypothetical protein
VEGNKMLRNVMSTASKLQESTQRLLESYSLAATAAGVGVLALASPSEGKIVYTPAHVQIKAGSKYRLDLNHDGVSDFLLKDVSTASAWTLSVLPVQGNGVDGFMTLSGGTWASALDPGSVVGARGYFPGKVMVFAAQSEDGGTQVIGSWANVTRRYLGLQFHIQGKVHYGWARLNVTAAIGAVSATLTGYAYETVPGKSIVAGKTSSEGDRGVSDPAASAGDSGSENRSLGTLALGRSRRSPHEQ